jgi:hypothetical protein
MKAEQQIFNSALNEFGAGKTELAEKKSNPKLFFEIPYHKKQNAKNAGIYKSCAKVKNDLEWFSGQQANRGFKNTEVIMRKEKRNKDFSKKIANKLVEQWWLNI